MQTDSMPSTPLWKQIAGFLGWFVLCFAAAGIGSAFTTPQIASWYAELNKPSFNPPNWIFGPVWSTLYLMMAISAWLVWRTATWKQAPVALGLFCVQLALNTVWSILFFGLENPEAAAVDIVLLWGAIVATIVLFWKYSRCAAILLVPYLAWVSFASLLNFTIAAMN